MQPAASQLAIRPSARSAHRETLASVLEMRMP
jgi:hypothetical protein